MTQKHPDDELIKALGGPSTLARRLGYDPEKGGVQRIQNWTVRGIPAAVRLKHLEIFGSVVLTKDPPARRTTAAAGETAKAAQAVLTSEKKRAA